MSAINCKLPMIAGGGGGSKGGNGYAEDPATLRSTGIAKVLDLLCEGEIEGLANGLASVYLAETPVRNPGGTYNFLQLDPNQQYNSGDPSVQIFTGAWGTQNQLPYPGFSDVESEVSVGVTVKNGFISTQTPTGADLDAWKVVREINDPSINAIRVRMGVNGLYTQNASGISGASVQYGIDLKIGTGAWQPLVVNPQASGQVKAMFSDNTFVMNLGPARTDVTLSLDFTCSIPVLSVPVVPAASNEFWPSAASQYDYAYQGAMTVQYEYQMDGGGWMALMAPQTYSASGSGNTVNDNYSYNSGYDSGRSVYVQDTPMQVTIPMATGVVTIRGRITDVNGTGAPTPEQNVVPQSGSSNLSTAFNNSTTEYLFTLSGCAKSRYECSHVIYLPAGAQPPYSIRVYRYTWDQNTATVQDTLLWESYTLIKQLTLNYPNSAVIGVVANAQLFSSIPSRYYDVKLLKVAVPSNYYPERRVPNCPQPVYDGIWDGTFKVVWSDNPAWCYQDLINSTRYGLGTRLGGVGCSPYLDKWEMYTIARYCDAVDDKGFFAGVPDGYGNVEVRFSCNVLITKAADAYQVLNSMTSVFRAISYWATNQVVLSQDAPQDPVQLFNLANITGKFSYTGTARTARHTVAEVTWNDPTNFCRPAVEFVEADPSWLKRYGYQVTKVTAFGCTSRGQAHRIGKWILYSELLETETVSFKTGLEGAKLMPGKILEVADPRRMLDQIYYGRAVGATLNSITVDRQITIEALPDQTITTAALDYAAVEQLSNSDAEALVARIASGSTAVDMNWDLNADGKVDMADALLASQGFRPSPYSTTSTTTTVPGAYTLSLMMPDGSRVTRVLTNTPGVTNILTFTTALPELPVAAAVVNLSASNNQTSLWRVISMKETTRTTLEIAALSHNPEKYWMVEDEPNFAKAVVPPNQVPSYQVDSPVGLGGDQDTFESSPGVRSNRLNVYWSNPANPYIAGYVAEYQAPGSTTWSAFPPADGNSRTLVNPLPGVYSIRVTSTSLTGLFSSPASITVEIATLPISLPPITGLQLFGATNSVQFAGKDIHITWNVPSNTHQDEATDTAGGGASFNWISGYIVNVIDTATGALLRTESPATNDYVYTFGKNAADHSPDYPARSITFQVAVQDTNYNKSSYALLSVSNPAPAALK